MTKLENAFGPEFVENFQKAREERIAERERLDEEELIKIADLAINHGKMEGGNPTFTFRSSSGVSHTVRLVEVPDPEERSYWSLKNDGNNDSVQLPLDYLGVWIWCWFNDRDLAKDLEPGENFIVIGNMTTWERDNGEEQEQFSPVRGLMSIEKAMEYANKALEDEGYAADDEMAVVEDEETTESTSDEESPFLSSDEEDTTEESDEESESGSGSDGLSGLMESEESEEEETPDVDRDDVVSELEEIAEQREVVWDLDESQNAKLVKLSNIIGNRLSFETNSQNELVDDDLQEEIKNIIIDRINEEQEDEEEEEDDDDVLF